MPQLIIGLGNPGGEYARTRHNVGWMCLDELERRGKFGRERREGSARVREGTIDGYDVLTARPQTFMNLSGKAAVQLTSKYGSAPRDMIVVHDEADFPLGRVKIKFGGSAAGHRGVQSLIDAWSNRRVSANPHRGGEGRRQQRSDRARPGPVPHRMSARWPKPPSSEPPTWPSRSCETVSNPR